MAKNRATFAPELTTRIVDLVRAGNYIETAAKAAGIHKSTYYAWMERGEAAAEAISRGEAVSDEEAAFADFYERVKIAEGLAEVDAIAAVREADRGWQAHMTYLERRFADRWRQQSGVRHVKSDERNESLEEMVARLGRERSAA